MIAISVGSGLSRTQNALTVKTVLGKTKCLSTQSSLNAARLSEVGKLLIPKVNEKYEAGQFFLHRIFGYRGVVLFPWRVKVYDRNPYYPDFSDSFDPSKNQPIEASTTTTTTTTTTSTAPDTQNISTDPPDQTAQSSVNQSADASDSDASRRDDKKEVSVNVQTYYQVLIDARDCPHVRAQTEAVTFLSDKDSNKNLYAIPGLDYVSHDDIIPYSVWSRDRKPLRHELFDKFLVHTGNNDISFKASETLHGWQERNHSFLELTEVHREITEGVRVTVIPFYMGSKHTPRTPVHWWRYSVRLENLGKLNVQLRERHWRIFALSGTLETVRGRGVVGHEPILNPADRPNHAYQYSSHVSLQAPSGHMWGTFLMERADGISFDCRIPPFALDSTLN